MIEETIGDLLKKYIDKLIGEDYDFSLASNRREALHNFCAIHKDKQFRPEKIRTYFRKSLTKCLKEKGRDPRSTGTGKRKASNEISDMEGEIIPEPQPEPTVQPSSTAIETEESQTSEEKETKQLQPLVQNISEEAIGAFFEGILQFVRIWYSDLEGLTENEKTTLARMWKPALQRYLSEKWVIIGVPLIATLGLIAPKLAKARKLKREKQGKKGHNDSLAM